MIKQKEEISISEIFHIFLPKLWLICLVGIICGMVVGIYSKFIKDETYSSFSTMYVYKSDSNVTTGDMTVAQDMVELYKIVLTSNDFLNSVIFQMETLYGENYNLTTSSIKKSLSISTYGKNGAFRIVVTTTNPELSYQLASCIEEYALPAIMNAIPNALSVTILESPKVAGPNSNNTLRNSALALFVGAIVAAVVVFCVNIFDVVIHDKKKIEDSFDIPILGVIPRHVITNSQNSEVKDV